jgi:hypothetical protein
MNVGNLPHTKDCEDGRCKKKENGNSAITILFDTVTSLRLNHTDQLRKPSQTATTRQATSPSTDPCIMIPARPNLEPRLGRQLHGATSSPRCLAGSTAQGD